MGNRRHTLSFAGLGLVVCVTVFAPSPLAAQASTDAEPYDDPVEVLMRFSEQVLAHALRIPNHTCVETIQRDRYEPHAGRSARSCDSLIARRKDADFLASLQLSTTDRLRLDVALSADREIYSWAGAKKFEEGDLDELVPEGAIGTGPFASMLIGVFQTHDPRFVFEGDTADNGRRLLDFTFTVPQDASHYRVKAHQDWFITGYSGEMLIDPRTAELVRLIIRTDELPPATETCETHTTLQYGMVAMGGIDYLLPTKAGQRYIGRDGAETENTVTFSSCREYRGESTLEFGDTAPHILRATDPPPAPVQFPPGLPMSVVIDTTIDSQRAAAGDRIEGRLLNSVGDGRPTLLASEGARLEGRLMRVETRHSTSPEVTVALRWETLEIGGAEVPVSLVPNRRVVVQKTVDRSGLRQRGMDIVLPLPNEGRYGVYHFPGDNAVMQSGFRTEWLTAEP